jgi:hypothetical protein
MRRLWTVVFLAMLLSGPSLAQTVSGTISGKVLDPSGAIVPSVVVTLENEETKQSRRTVANDAGEFVFTAVPPGTYSVSLEAKGFQSARRTGVVLPADARVPLGEIRLAVGEVTQTVTVAESGERISTENADVEGRLTSRQLDQQIIKGRDPMSLLHTLPGVTTGLFVNGSAKSETDPDGASSLGGEYGTLTPPMNGGRMFWNTITVDGQVSSNPDWPGLSESAISADSVAEMKVTSSNYTAEYGRNLGSNITMVTKSGTKEFHGSGYWFKRHEMFNANDFFNNRDGLSKPYYRYTNFGGTVGGPIYIPRLFNTGKEKLFFFYNQEEWRTRQPISPYFLTVPTQAERQGNFSNTLDQSGRLIPVNDPTNKQPFPGNIIPASRINPNGQVLLNVMPLPNQLDRSLTKGAYNYEWQDVCQSPKRMQGLKTDYAPRSADRFSLGLRRWWSDVRAYTCLSLGYSSLPLLQHHYLYSTDNALLNWTHVFGATATNEFSIGMVGEKEGGPVPGPFPDRAATYFDPVKRSKVGYTLGQFYGAANPYGLIPQATFGGVPNAASITHDARLPGQQGYSRFHMNDHYSWVRGGHTFKFGLDFEMNWANDGPSSACGDGCFAFGRDPNNPGDTNWAFSNALVGNFASYQETNNRPRYRYARKNWEWFAQDTWKVSRKLTLTYGMRFAAFTNWNLVIGTGSAFVPDLYSAAKESPYFRPALDASGNRVAIDPTTGTLFPARLIGAFVPGVGDTYSGTLPSTSQNYPRDFQTGQPVQVAPRFGFAYDVFGDGKMAVRGGFGVAKETLPTYGSSSGRTIFNAPSQLNPQVFYGNMDTLLQSVGVLFPSNTGALEKDFKTPSIYYYSLGVQRGIGFNTVLDVSYVGNVGRHLLQTVNINQLPYGIRFQPGSKDPTTGSALSDVFLRPYQGYQSITDRIYNGISNYNALQASATRRFTKGLQLGVAYTWSKTNGYGSGEAGALPTYLSPKIWVYGPTAWDQTQMAVFNYVWDLPQASKLAPNPVVRFALDHWTLSGVTTLASGFPQSVTLSTTDNADLTGGGDGVRPLMIAGAQLSHGDRSLQQWFNTAAFARPPQGSFGNTPISPVRGPGFNNWDATLMKRFHLKSEARFFEFRWEAYNLFNHTQFFAIDSSALFDPTGKQVNGRFGQAYAARPSRIMQLALRFNF